MKPFFPLSCLLLADPYPAQARAVYTDPSTCRLAQAQPLVREGSTALAQAGEEGAKSKEGVRLKEVRNARTNMRIRSSIGVK